MKPIAICENLKISNHSTSWVPKFIKYCKDNDISYEIIDCYRYDIVSLLPKYSALIWNYSHFIISDKMEAANIIQVAENMGLKTFPSNEEAWHFDDKIAEMYALQAVGAPIPESWVFYIKEDCIDWLKNKAKYPLVAKLRDSSGSNNVKLLKNSNEAIRYADVMFGKGLNPSPSLIYKSFSKIQSTHNFKTFTERFKRIPEFLRTRRNAKMLPIERGYCYFQEFIPNDGFDLKIVVCNDKLSFIERKIRKSDFRASGGGECYYDKTLISEELIDIAFDVCDKLKSQCIGFDFVLEEKTNKPLIIEMCYGFDADAVSDCGGYFDRKHNWYNEPLYVTDEIIKKICKS